MIANQIYDMNSTGYGDRGEKIQNVKTGGLTYQDDNLLSDELIRPPYPQLNCAIVHSLDVYITGV